MRKWYLETGPDSDVILSTRVRLARNLQNVPFPIRMTPEQRKAVDAQIKDALLGSHAAIAGDFDYLEMQDTSPAQALSMMERHLISPEFAQAKDGALLLMKDESVSIMINEEDHLRIQVMRPGLDLQGAYEMADQLDTLLDERLTYAFDERLGYLTQCPTNLGTGMRASLMLHLPALQREGVMGQLSDTVSKLGLTIRGLYGEGTEPKGAIYQLSNQVTLGISEQAALQNLKSIAMQVIAQERAARQQLNGDLRLTDQVWRSYGLLRTARILTGEEFMQLISNVRLGAALGILTEVTLDEVANLILNAQPGCLTMRVGKNLTPAERDVERASWVREQLAKTET